jgi:hypothetical protein
MVNAMAAVVLMVLAIMLVFTVGAIAAAIIGISALCSLRRPAVQREGLSVGADEQRMSHSNETPNAMQHAPRN